MRKLVRRYVEKPWGRTELPAIFARSEGGRIGEIWFEDESGQDQPLLVKYIFTTERLSIQVHPSDAQAQLLGLPRGKEEIWYILDCEPNARLGIGLNRSLSPEAFRAAALDGSLEQFIDWKPVKPGDCYFIPAGTIHAIGAGIALAEIQQNSDITYRLYDYGRPRELHLDAGAAVSKLETYNLPLIEAPLGRDVRLVSTEEAPFWVDLLHWDEPQQVKLPFNGPMWFTPLEGSGTIGSETWTKGECWLVDAGQALTTKGPASVLLAGPR